MQYVLCGNVLTVTVVMTEELSVSSKESDKADMRLVQAAADDVSESF